MFDILHRKYQKKQKNQRKLSIYTTIFSRRTNTDPTLITRKDSGGSKNTSPAEDNVSESEEGIVLKDNPLSTDSSSSVENDGYN